MCRLVVIEHEVDDVELGADEDDLECRVPQILSRIGPEQVQVSGYVDGEVEELRFEGDAGGALHEKSARDGHSAFKQKCYTRRAHLRDQYEDGCDMRQVAY